MKNLLPARPLWSLAFLLLLALLVRPAFASHLLGGELTYRYIDNAGPAAAPLRYELSITVYNNCSSSTSVTPYDDATVGIYERSTGARLVLTTVNYPRLMSGNLYIATQPLSTCYQPPIVQGCPAPTVTQPYIFQKFVALVNLPNTTAGFYAVWSESARNNDITNLANMGGQNIELYTTLSPPSIFNRSPVFTNSAVTVMCTNDTTTYLSNAVDADNDELEYSFGTPYGGALPPSPITLPLTTVGYAAGTYSATTPFGTGRGFVNHLNTSTGVATFATTRQGKYVVAIDIKEYRVISGVRTLIGTTRRDVMLIVTACPTSTGSPIIPPPVATGGTTTVLPRNYTIEAGTTQTIPISATQRGLNPLTLTVNSVLLDGPGGYNATFNGNSGTLSGQTQTGTASASGTAGVVTGSFVYTASCTEARTAPYDIAVTVEDKGCAGKTTYDVFRITVVKPQGPTAITGDAVVCGTTTSSYTASGGTTPGVTWSVTGGTIVGSPTANPVQVQWTSAGTGTISLQGVSQGGCLTDVVTKNVAVSVAPALTVTGNRTVCQGTSTTITVGGAVAGATYVVTGGPVSGSGTTFTLTPTATTTYTVTATSPGNSCAGTSQFTVTVNPAAAPVVAPPVAVCSGLPVQIGSAPVAGNTYSWSPTTGLSSATVANPTVTLTNTTNAAITQTYTLTVTTATGCTGTTTVAVTVNPAVVATTATTVTTVTDAPVALGSAPVAGFAYSWSPATGLSNASIANPTVTLPNYTGIPITRTYTLTTTNTATGCVGTATVVVTVNPDLTFEVYNNVITANGDNLNDRLKVRNIKSFPNNKVEIYNRWGRQIFTTNNYDNDTNYWGTDPILVAGNYYYIFKQGDNTIAKGWIEVVR